MGKFGICIKDTFGDEEVEIFFKEIIENFARESFAHWEIWGRFPFIYREKQLNSVLTPAIHNYTQNIWLEEPFRNRENKKRFLDIATVKDNKIFLIELKHSWIHKKGKTKKDWETAIKQISDIDENTIEGSFNIDYNLIKIALMIVPTYIPIDKENGKEILKLSEEEYVDNLFQEYTNNEDKNYFPNLIGTIKINNSKEYIYKSKNGNEIYPFVSFIAKIERVN